MRTFLSQMKKRPWTHRLLVAMLLMSWIQTSVAAVVPCAMSIGLAMPMSEHHSVAVNATFDNSPLQHAHHQSVPLEDMMPMESGDCSCEHAACETAGCTGASSVLVSQIELSGSAMPSLFIPAKLRALISLPATSLFRPPINTRLA